MDMRRVPLLATLMVFASVGAATTAENFRLLDQNRVTHELHWLSDAAAVVIMIQGNGCPIARNAWPTYREIRAEYEGRDVEFLMLNSNLQDNQSNILREAETFRMDIPILVDETQEVGESLGVIRTAEVFVIDPKQNWEVVYRGPVDDRLTYEHQKAVATENYLHDALDAVLAGKPIEVAQRDALGCLVNFPNRQAQR